MYSSGVTKPHHSSRRGQPKVNAGRDGQDVVVTIELSTISEPDYAPGVANGDGAKDSKPTNDSFGTNDAEGCVIDVGKTLDEQESGPRAFEEPYRVDEVELGFGTSVPRHLRPAAPVRTKSTMDSTGNGRGRRGASGRHGTGGEIMPDSDVGHVQVDSERHAWRQSWDAGMSASQLRREGQAFWRQL